MLPALYTFGLLLGSCIAAFSEDNQNRPGFGIDLTMAYGAAAVQFPNGTVIDVAKINGSPFYRMAMRMLSEDAMNSKQGKDSQLKPDHLYSNALKSHISFPYLHPQNWYSYIHQKLSTRLCTQLPYIAPEIDDPWLSAIAEMLSSLKAEIDAAAPSATLGPISYVSLPDWDKYGEPYITYRRRVRKALEKANFNAPDKRFAWASFAALWYQDIQDCDEDTKQRPECDETNGTAIHQMLTVIYTEASFGVSRLGKYLGAFIPNDSAEYAEHGAGCDMLWQDPGTYWKQVESFVRGAVDKYKIDYLMLLGDHSLDNGLLVVLKRIFEERVFEVAIERHSQYHAVFPSYDTLPQSSSQPQLQLRSEGDQEQAAITDHTFATARGLAMAARTRLTIDLDEMVTRVKVDENGKMLP